MEIMKWISVDKYLPPFHQSVLIHMPNIEDCPEIAVGFMEHDGNFYFNQKKEADKEMEIEYAIVEDIKHWMPLPEPPK